MNILFVMPYPAGVAPSQRFRFEQYLEMLQEAGHTYTLAPFIDDTTWKILYKPGNVLQKSLGVLKGFGRRLLLLSTLKQYDWIFIHREAAPLGPPVFEWLATQVFKKKVIFDFDDAIWLPNTSAENKIAAHIKWHKKTASISKWSHKVSCGNDYLANWARQHNPQVVYNPTTIDTVNLHNRLKQHQEGSIVIGWTGSHSTLKYLNPIEDILAELANKYPQLRFLVISSHAPDIKVPRLEFRPWRKETEAADLLEMDIGIMPLTHDQWSEGKCGFKALQYMSMGIPSVISPVGVNTKIIAHGKNGFLADGAQDWKKYISLLIEDTALRQRMGRAARASVESNFSVAANRTTFLRLFTTTPA